MLIKLSNTRKKLLKTLLKKMNSSSTFPLPITNDLLECLNIAITKEELFFLNKLDSFPYTYFELLEISELNKADFDKLLKCIINKGFLNKIKDKDNYYKFYLSNILPGWFEIYLSSNTDIKDKKKFIVALEKYSNTSAFINHFPLRNIFNLFMKKYKTPFTEISKTHRNTKFVSLNKNIERGEWGVYPFNYTYQLIDKYAEKDEIAVINCFCRYWRELLDDPCNFDQENQTCIIIGKASEAVINSGIGEKLEKSEALNIIKRTSEKGAIQQIFHQSMNLQKLEVAICNCCWDCCGVLRTYNKGLSPLYIKSYNIAEIAYPNECITCRRCERFCPTNAVKIRKNKLELDPCLCIGCGQCRLQCKQGVFELLSKERNLYLPLQKKSDARIK